MWKEGSIRVNGEVFHYWMKQYDKGSEWGIDAHDHVGQLDGGDIDPADENTQLALELLLHSENW